MILDSAIDTAIIALDQKGCVLKWSAGAERILGWNEPEMLGQPLARIFPSEEDGAAKLADEMTGAGARGRDGHEGWRLRKDGRRFWAIGEMAPVDPRASPPVAFVKILRDRTDWKLIEDSLREETRTLEILNRIGATVARETDLASLVQAVTDAGVELSGAAFGAFFYNVKDSGGESYTLYTLSGLPKDAFAKFPMPRNTAIFAPTFAGKAVVRADDITKDSRYGLSDTHHGMPKDHLKVVSYLAVPMVSRSGEVLGGLFFGHPEAGVFTDRSERLVTAMAAEAAIGIDNARLFQALETELQDRRRAEEALQALNATLEQQAAERTE